MSSYSAFICLHDNYHIAMVVLSQQNLYKGVVWVGTNKTLFIKQMSSQISSSHLYQLCKGYSW